MNQAAFWFMAFRIPPAQGIVRYEVDYLKQTGGYDPYGLCGRKAHTSTISPKRAMPPYSLNRAGLPMFMNIPGENLVGGLFGHEYLPIQSDEASGPGIRKPRLSGARGSSPSVAATWPWTPPGRQAPRSRVRYRLQAKPP